MSDICDDALVTQIGQELSRIGLFVPISIVEQSVITIYTRLCEAASNNRNLFTLDSRLKTSIYYDFLSSAVLVDLVSKSRLPKIRNKFELNSVMLLLNGYLKNLNDIAEPKQLNTGLLFTNVAIPMPDDIQAEIDAGANPEDIANEFACISGAGQAPKTSYPCKFKNAPVTNEPKLSTDNNDEYDDHIKLTIEYANTCFSFKISPELIGLNEYRDECDIRVFKNFIKNGTKLFLKQSDKIFDEFYNAYNEN